MRSAPAASHRKGGYMKRHHERDANKIAAILKAITPHPDASGMGIPDHCGACYDVGTALYACTSTGLAYYLALGILAAHDAAEPSDNPESRTALKTFLRLVTIDGKSVEPTACLEHGRGGGVG